MDMDALASSLARHLQASLQPTNSNSAFSDPLPKETKFHSLHRCQDLQITSFNISSKPVDPTGNGAKVDVSVIDGPGQSFAIKAQGVSEFTVSFQIQSPSPQNLTSQYTSNVGSNTISQAPYIAPSLAQYAPIPSWSSLMGSSSGARTMQTQGGIRDQNTTSTQSHTLPSLRTQGNGGATNTEFRQSEIPSSQPSDDTKLENTRICVPSQNVDIQAKLSPSETQAIPWLPLSAITPSSSLLSRGNLGSVNPQSVSVPSFGHDGNSVNMSPMNTSYTDVDFSKILSKLSISSGPSSPTSTSSTETITPYRHRSSRSFGLDGPGFPINTPHSDLGGGDLKFPDSSPSSLRHSTFKPFFFEARSDLTRPMIKAYLRFLPVS